MGHLTLISEDVIGALEHFPPDLRLVAAQYAPQPEWDEYVTGRYKETKRKDTSLLGGGKPAVAPGMRNGSATQWKVDEADTGVATTVVGSAHGDNPVQEMKGEFRRTPKMREASADFGAGHMEEEDDEFSTAGPPHVSLSSKPWGASVVDCGWTYSSPITLRRRFNHQNTSSQLTKRLMTKRKMVDGWHTQTLICGHLPCLLGSTTAVGDH